MIRAISAFVRPPSSMHSATTDITAAYRRSRFLWRKYSTSAVSNSGRLANRPDVDEVCGVVMNAFPSQRLIRMKQLTPSYAAAHSLISPVSSIRKLLKCIATLKISTDIHVKLCKSTKKPERRNGLSDFDFPYPVALWIERADLRRANHSFAAAKQVEHCALASPPSPIGVVFALSMQFAPYILCDEEWPNDRPAQPWLEKTKPPVCLRRSEEFTY